MSGIAGAYRLDGGPIDPALLHCMGQAMAHRGPDGITYWASGSVGLVHLKLTTTSEAVYETQPLPNEDCTLCLTMDGRVDNREALHAAIEAKGCTPRDDTDAELVLRAYEVWGEESTRRILGDFSYVIWDARKRRLFCARDFYGAKPFYYYHDGKVFLWASEVRPLLDTGLIHKRPNEGMVAEFLADNVTNLEETLYQGIMRLPPAHFMLVRPEGVRKQRYWDIDPAHEVRYKTDDQYAEHFLEVFTRALRCMLRSHLPVGITLSGGVDSSSITCLAQDLVRRGTAPCPRVKAYSLVFPGLECDESDYIKDVVAKCGISSELRLPFEPDASWYNESARESAYLPCYPTEAMLNSIRSQAKGDSSRVLLNGSGGDEWFIGSPLHITDLIRAGQFFGVGPALRSYAANFGVSRSLLIRRYVAPTVVPAWVRTTYRALLGRGEPVGSWVLLNPGSLGRSTIDPLRAAHVGKLRQLARREAYSSLVDGWHLVAFEAADCCSAGFSLEERRPLYSRPLVEFALGLPADQCFRDGITRYVVRHALRTLLPSSIAQRKTKADFSHLMARALRNSNRSAAWESLAISKAGWINGEIADKVSTAVELKWLQGGEAVHPHLWGLWIARTLEIWYESNFSSG
jgi:asparagine synthase (glutamine-hydrolysing)